MYPNLIIALLILIIAILYVQIRKSHKLFKDLSDAFNNGKKIDNQSLVERIIGYKKVYTNKPDIKSIELISNFINEFFSSSRVFIHHTNDIEIARKIITEGFLYTDNFYKSTEELTSNEIDIIYKMQLYKYYGNYVIVICIPNHLFQQTKKEDINWDNDILEEIGVSESYRQNDFNYKLPSKYIKGYIDLSNNQIVDNEGFQKVIPHLKSK
jgi:hypothetical protein